MMKASSTACMRPNRLPMMASEVMPWARRSSKGSKPAKTTAASDELVKVAPEKPAKATASRTPGVACMISEASRVTESVRLSEEPCGSWRSEEHTSELQALMRNSYDV